MKLKPKSHNIIKASLAVFLIACVAFLNFGFIVCTGIMDGDCCKVKEVPACCRHKEAKQTERISAYCGCEMKETGNKVDLYYGPSVAVNKLSFKDFIFTSISADIILSAYSLTSIITRPPPILSVQGDMYITNRNLRI